MAGKPVDKEEVAGPEAPTAKTTKAKGVGKSVSVIAGEAKQSKKEIASSRLNAQPNLGGIRNDSLTEIKGIGQKIAGILIAAGYDTSEKIKVLTVEDLVKLEGIGEKTADKILKAANAL